MHIKGWVVVLATMLSMTLGGTVATAKPLPDTGIRAQKGLTGTIDIAFAPGSPVPVTVVPGGDLAVGYDCRTSAVATSTGADVSCVKDAGSAYVFTCTNVDVAETGFQFPDARVQASAYCADTDEAHVATYDSANRDNDAEHNVFPITSGDRVGCSANGVPASRPFTIRCTFRALGRQPIEGGILIEQFTVGGLILVTELGVLADDSLWRCVQEVTWPPTVVCDRNSKTIDWYCNHAFVEATADGPLPSVRGQLSCDGNRAAIPPGRTDESMSTEDVPTSGGVPTSVYGETRNYNTEQFICQAWGPLNTPVPVAPWSVLCWEP